MNELISLRLCVDESYGIGYLIRTIRADGGTFTHLLSRKTGEWVPCTEEQIKEHIIPSECVFATGALPSVDDPS
jgi:hypothetical protein